VKQPEEESDANRALTLAHRTTHDAHANPSAARTHASDVPLPPIGPMTRAKGKVLQKRLSSLIHRELELELLIEDAELREKALRLVTLLMVAPSASVMDARAMARNDGPM